MYCGKCGTKMPEDNRICPNCGADMSDRPLDRDEPRKTEKPGFFRRLINKITGQ